MLVDVHAIIVVDDDVSGEQRELFFKLFEAKRVCRFRMMIPSE